MAYIRPQQSQSLTKTEKVALLREYVAHYEEVLVKQGIAALNTKIPREVFSPVLEAIGETLLLQSERLLRENAEVQDFLENNPLPSRMAELLPDNFRVFALLLNALKQWVSAESAATDRFLLGGAARQTCREAVTHCIVTKESFDDSSELHHPVRDGRPPILLSKKGHDMVEGVIANSSSTMRTVLTEPQNQLWQKLQTMRSQRNQSWKQLREGCMAFLNPDTQCRAGAKSFANVVMRETGKSPQEVIELLDMVKDIRSKKAQ